MQGEPQPTSLASRRRGNRAGKAGMLVVLLMLAACLGSMPWTLGRVNDAAGSPRHYEATQSERSLLPPWWAPHTADEAQRRDDARQVNPASGLDRAWLGTDRLGRDLLVRCLAGGAISLTVGLVAAAISVIIGTLYGTIAGWCGGRIDAAMMRIVDVFYGLPYVLLVVLLAVAADGLIERVDAGKQGLFSRDVLNVATLLVAIGGVSWLTMARVIRGQVLSLKQQPFMEACRAIGVPLRRQFTRHLLPNLLGPIIVYATLTVPTAILSESFLSFLGIGIQEPLPSWGNLASAGLSELNVVRARWWLLLWPCVFVGVTLLALNFMGEGLRERFDPKRSRH
jgi:oligopeptide transport system permease protein